MKKSFVKVFVSVMLLLLMTVVLCFGVGAFVEGPTMEEFHENIEQYIDYDVIDGKAIINNVNIEGYLMWDITIPSSLGGYPVTELSDGCFMYCTLDNIIIPETVTAIGDLFFDGSCTGYIVDANNPCFSSDNENEYNGGALFNKDKTELLKFPIGDGDAFNIKTEYKIPDTVKIIGEAAFSGCNSLEAVTVSDSVTKIGNSAFENCENLKSVALGKNIEEIGMSAFLDCYSLYDVRYTGSEADWERISIASGNDYLLEADIEFNYDPASAYKCGDNVFFELDEKTGVLKISGEGFISKPFKENKKIKEVIIEDGVTSICDFAFEKCVNLEKITIPSSVTSIGNYAFQQSGLKSIVIPEGVINIGYCSFRGCPNLKHVTIPASVMSIENAFEKSYKITSIIVDENNANFSCDTYGALFNKDKTVLINYPVGNERKTYVLPDTVKTIDWSVFYNCRSLEAVTVPDSVTKIERFAFANCENLKSVALGKNIEEIGMCAFQNCKSLKEIVIPDKVTLLDYCLFDGCTSLEKVTIGAGVSEMDYVQFGFTVFNDCFNIKQFVVKSENMHYSTDALGNLYNKNKTEFIRYATGSSAECFVIPNTVQKIKTEAFQGGNSLRTVVIPVSVKEMWVSVFEMAETKKGTLEYIYYKGTAEQWKNIMIGYRNDTLYSARIFYNYNEKALTKPLSITSAQSTTALRLSWAPVIAADGYRVFLKTATGWKALGNTVNTTVIFNNLKPASKFTFAVMAGKIVNGKVQWAKEYATINTATKTVAPAKIVSAQNSSAIRLSWTKCEGATGYRIYRYQNGEWKIALSTTDKTSHTFTGLKPGAVYTLAVRPYIKNGNSIIWSDHRVYYRAATCPVAPATAVASSNGKVTLKWSAVNGADAYQLFFKIGDGEYKLYKNYDEAQTVSFNNLTKGTKITFAVRGATKTDEKWIFGSFKPVSVTVK